MRELLKLEPELAWAANVAGEMPIWRCMTSTSSQTKAADADILDQLLQHTQASDMEKVRAHVASYAPFIAPDYLAPNVLITPSTVSFSRGCADG